MQFNHMNMVRAANASKTCALALMVSQGENYAKQWPFIIYFVHIGKDACLLYYTQLQMKSKRKKNFIHSTKFTFNRAISRHLTRHRVVHGTMCFCFVTSQPILLGTARNVCERERERERRSECVCVCIWSNAYNNIINFNAKHSNFHALHWNAILSGVEKCFDINHTPKSSSWTWMQLLTLSACNRTVRSYSPIECTNNRRNIWFDSHENVNNNKKNDPKTILSVHNV